MKEMVLVAPRNSKREWVIVQGFSQLDKAVLVILQVVYVTINHAITYNKVLRDFIRLYTIIARYATATIGYNM